MIQIQKPKSKRKILTITSIFILLIIGSIGAYLYYFNKNMGSDSGNAINTEKPTKQQIKAGQASKDATIKGGSSDTGNLDTEEAAHQDDGSTPQVLITAAGQNGDMIQVRSLINSVTTSGSCTLTLKNGSSSVTKTVSIQALADSSTCQGFDIPSNEFANKGTWAATLTYNDPNGSTQASNDIIIK